MQFLACRRPAGLEYTAVAAMFLLLLATLPSLAADSPFGVAIPDASPPAQDGVLKTFFLWVGAKQSEFYLALVNAIKEMKASGSAGWLLIGLSFLYGLFHGAGPGHGKVVVSSYVLASNETARTGIIMSFATAMVQALSAVILIGVTAIALNMTSIAITETARVFEVGSYALVAGLGLFLVYRKVAVPVFAALRKLSREPAPAHAAASAGHDHHHHDHHHDHDHHHHHNHHHHHDHHHGDGHCCHITGEQTAQAIARSQTPIRDALAPIFAVGIRPCSGALIVLVFAFSQGLFWAGIVSVFAMGLGTAIVVSLLVYLSVTARDVALRLTGLMSSRALQFQRIVEGLAAVFVLAIGCTLLYATLLQPAF